MENMIPTVAAAAVGMAIGGALHKKANKMPQRNPMARCGRPKPLYFKGNTA